MPGVAVTHGDKSNTLQHQPIAAADGDGRASGGGDKRQ